MKNIVCICDCVIDEKLMEPLKGLEQFGAKVSFVYDPHCTSIKKITESMLVYERQGVDELEASQEVIEACSKANIIVSHVGIVNSQIIKAASELEYVCILRSGYENTNVETLKECGVKLVNAPTRSADAVADFTVGMMIAENKNIAKAHHDMMNGKWIKKYPNFDYSHDLRKSTIGIIGYGQIGQRVIKRLQAFGCKIVVHDPFVPEADLVKQGVDARPLNELLAISDYVSLHMRLSEQNENYFSKPQFEMMKPTAYFINTSRAGLVCEDDLLDALENKVIGGAGIDVFNEEPLANKRYLELDNITVTPHVAGTSVDTFSNSVEICCDSIEQILNDQAIQYLVKLG